MRRQLSIIFWPSFLWRADATELPHICRQVLLWLTGGTHAAAAKFLAGVYAAHCKDAAAPKFLAGVPVARCTDGATAKFLTSVSVSRCKDAADEKLLADVSAARC